MNGELDFAASLQARVALLKGLGPPPPRRIIEQMDVTPGAKDLNRNFIQRVTRIGMVGGGFHEVIDPIAFGN